MTTGSVALLMEAGRRFGEVEALAPQDLRLDRGETVAVTGPSGSGKSTLLHMLALLVAPSTGSARILGVEAGSLSPAGADRLRRGRIGISFQDDPLVEAATARENVALAMRLTGRARTDREALRLACSVLEEVGLGGRGEHLPGLLSGGERARLALVRALAVGADLVLADEPTASLDGSTARAVLRSVLRALGTGPARAFVTATHDPAVARLASRSIDLGGVPFLEWTPVLPDSPPPAPGDAVVEARGVHRTFRWPGGAVDVLRDATLTLRRGECVALSGPSGSGKTTLLAVLAGLERIDGGGIRREGLGSPAPRPGDLDRWRARSVGYVSQVDPLPRFLPPMALLRIARGLAERNGVPAERLQDPAALLRRLAPGVAAHRSPSTLSGGERRRVAVARALVHRPPLLLADEPAAGLDRASGAAVLGILRDHARTGAAVLFATHDPLHLAFADRVLHLENGVITEPERVLECPA